MNIGLFGGTFDPIHSGHLRSAKVAARKFHLDKVLFVPSGNPPHKRQNRLTPFLHRFAMVALACAQDPTFVPSLLEAPAADGHIHYSVDTVRAAKLTLGPVDRLYFLLGLDSFLDLPHWKDYRLLFGMVNFIVVSRPGFSSQRLLRALPKDLIRQSLRPRSLIQTRQQPEHGRLHILHGVDAPVASREIRGTVRRGQQLTGLVPKLVEQYIVKEALYRRKAGWNR